MPPPYLLKKYSINMWKNSLFKDFKYHFKHITIIFYENIQSAMVNSCSSTYLFYNFSNPEPYNSSSRIENKGKGL